MPPVTVRLTEPTETIFREHAARADLRPGTFGRQLIEAALAAPIQSPSEAAELLPKMRDLIERLAARVCLLEELLLTLVSKGVGGDHDERQKKVQVYFSRAEVRGQRKAARLFGTDALGDAASEGAASRHQSGAPMRRPHSESRPRSDARRRPASFAPAPDARPFPEQARAVNTNARPSVQAEGAQRATRAEAGGAALPTPGPARRRPSPSLIARVTGEDRR